MALPARAPSDRPLIIAHRGASAARAEHTLAAYALAIEVGADGLECDVRLTRDGQLVCIHDRTINRTSNGTGTVSKLDLAQLQGLDFSSGTDPAAPGVLTLRELLELVRDAGRPVRLLIETKHPNRFGGRLEQDVIALLARFGWTGTRDGDRADDAHHGNSVAVMSFAKTAIRRVHRLAPNLPAVVLMNALPAIRRSGILPSGAAIAGPSLDLVRRDPRFVERAHALGHLVYVWTVDETADIQRVARLGVDAIITNCPAEAIEALGR